MFKGKKVEDLTKEEIEEILKDNDINDVVNKCSKNDLCTMHETVYGRFPRTGQKKLEVVQTMQTYFYTQNRAKAFNWG